MMASAIDVTNVSFSYKSDEGQVTGKKALDNISLEIAEGSYCAVLGPNGSGKSTLAKIIDVLEFPDEGKIAVLGNEVTDEESIYGIRERCSYVFQNPDNQIVGTIVEEDVAFGPENMGIPLPELRNRVDDALKYVGLYELRGREAASLSGGQKQKLAIAGALAMKPDVLILDEATAMLDPVSRDEFLDLIEKMNREKGITVLTITHDMNEAARCDRIFVIENGKVTMSGTAPEIFSHPRTVRNAGLDLPFDVDLLYEIAELAEVTVEEKDIRSRDSIIDSAVRFALMAKTMPKEPIRKVRKPGRKLLEISSLSHSYDGGNNYAIRDINLDVYQGEILAVVGKSGCGKTTLISHLNGLIRPQSGAVRFFDKEGNVYSTDRKKDVARIRGRVGIEFQYPEYQVFEETVERDIAYGLIKTGASEVNIEGRVKAAASLSGVSEDVLSQSPFELSGGQKRRVALAGVLVMKPDIMVLDEPAAGLDPLGRRDMFETILALRESGTTVVIVSHNMDEAARYADRIVCINDGRIVSCGSPSELFESEEKAERLGISMPILYGFSDEIKKRIIKERPGVRFNPPFPEASMEARSIVRSVLSC